MAISLLYAVPSSLGLFIEVLTHGYWLEQSRIEQMAFARPGRIRVSVDAIGATHSLVRGRGKFWDYTLATLNTSPRPTAWMFSISRSNRSILCFPSPPQPAVREFLALPNVTIEADPFVFDSGFFGSGFLASGKTGSRRLSPCALLYRRRRTATRRFNLGRRLRQYGIPFHFRRSVGRPVF